MRWRSGGRVPRPSTLTGQVVAITGAARGIGAATARAFVAAGARVAIGDIDAELAQRTAAEIGAIAAGVDVTDDHSVGAFLDDVEERLGTLDVMVNNAGIMPVVGVLDETAESVRRQLAVNVAGVIHGTRHAARRMVPRGSGRVVNVASAAGRMAFGGVATYSGSKFAVVDRGCRARTSPQRCGIHVRASRGGEHRAHQRAPRPLVAAFLRTRGGRRGDGAGRPARSAHRLRPWSAPRDVLGLRDVAQRRAHPDHGDDGC
ncbi:MULTISPECIES: SDR family NAD(P)-dependent oxidoreductase [unclassified Mycolicibacterium]